MTQQTAPERPRPSNGDSSSRPLGLGRWQFAALIGLVTWCLANLPFVVVWWEYRDAETLAQLFRLYPGQFLFLLGPFLLATVFTWMAWWDAVDLYNRHDIKIPLFFRPLRVFVPFAILIAIIIPVGGIATEGPELYGRKHVETAIKDFDEFLAERFGGAGQRESPLQAGSGERTRTSTKDAPGEGGSTTAPGPNTTINSLAAPWKWGVAVTEFVELFSVVFVAFHLFVGAGLLAYSKRKAALDGNSQDVTVAWRASVWVILALTAFLVWPPLRMATLKFIDELQLPGFFLFARAISVIAVMVAILATSIFVISLFITAKTAKWLIITLYTVTTTAFVLLFTIRDDIVFRSLSDWAGIANVASVILVVVVALGLLVPFVRLLMEGDES